MEICIHQTCPTAGAVGVNGAYFERIGESTEPPLAHNNGDCVENRLYPGVACQSKWDSDVSC